jgi:hypothetical protein
MGIGMGSFPEAKLLNLDGEALDIRKLSGVEPFIQLRLNGKKLGPASGMAIGRMLVVNGAMTTLSISYNKIGDAAKQELSKIATDRPTLTINS